MRANHDRVVEELLRLAKACGHGLDNMNELRLVLLVLPKTNHKNR